jgi:small-conductance mechanosensitive channel
MMSLSFRNPADAATLLQQTLPNNPQPAEEITALPTAAEQMRQSVEVLLSPEAQKAAKTGDKNADIDASHLPDRIKEQLKMIRAIQERIAKRMQDMQAFMSDRSLSPKMREGKMRQLQMEIMAMTNSLIQATNDLNQAMQQMKLSLADRTLAGTLVSPQNLQS